MTTFLVVLIAVFSSIIILLLSNLFSLVRSMIQIFDNRLRSLEEGYGQVLAEYRDTIKQNDGLMLRVQSIQQENEMLRAKLHTLQKQ